MRLIVSLVALGVFALAADAGPLRGRRPLFQQTTYKGTATASSACGPNGCTISATRTEEFSRTTMAGPGASGTAIDEVNAKRAARGLRPFLHDPLLTEAAQKCAEFRARHRLFGHTNNDFGFLGFGARASAAGCAAYEPHYGWLSCCTYDGYTYAGAAYVVGADGKRYMHLFVR